MQLHEGVEGHCSHPVVRFSIYILPSSLPVGQLLFLHQHGTYCLPIPLTFCPLRYQGCSSCPLYGCPNPATTHILKGCQEVLSPVDRIGEMTTQLSLLSLMSRRGSHLIFLSIMHKLMPYEPFLSSIFFCP